MNLFLRLALIILLIYNFGCKEDTVSPVVNNNLSLSITSPSIREKDLSGNILIIDSAKFLMKYIRLKYSSNNDSVNFKSNLFVIYLKRDSSVNLISSGAMPINSYSTVRFEVHKLDTGEYSPDPEFVDALGRYSLIVKGSFNIVPFIYKSSNGAYQSLLLNRILELQNNQVYNITVKVNSYDWFRLGNEYLNPSNPANQNIIDGNIANSFVVFIDNNRDGIPDL